jgi:dTDP-4-dehydrorhamnose reductase
MSMPSDQLRVLVLGANGRLGRALTRLYAPRHRVTGWTRQQLDLTDTSSIPALLGDAQFDLLINAAGLTSVDQCETDTEIARLTNLTAPQLMAEACAQRGARFIHVSTDYVFAGDGRTPLTEADTPAPLNEYGRTKLAGEQAVLAACPSALVARVSWLFGPDKKSFPDTVIEDALLKPVVLAVNDKWSCPTYADDLAKWIETLFVHHPSTSGVIHLCNSGYASWQEYGQRALEIAEELGLPLVAKKVTGHSMHGFERFKAIRPPFTALSTSRFTSITGISPRHWEDAIREHLVRQFGPPD